MSMIAVDRKLLERALKCVENTGYPLALIADLRAALAQEQAEPVVHGQTIDDAMRETREKAQAYEAGWNAALAQQAEPLNLRDPAVQKRLATQWGYVPAAAQAEPVQDQRCRAEPRSDGDFVCDCKIGECPGRSAEPAQEPVAWRWGYRSVTTGEMDWHGYVEIAAHPDPRHVGWVEPLYTAPPQRKLVPLTEEEIKTAFHAARNAKLGASQDNSRHRLSVIEIARAVEKASWEKNHGQA